MSSVSVVLCTRDRASRLPRIVRSIFRAARSVLDYNVELLVVDNASTDETQNVLLSLAAESNIPLRVVDAPEVGVCRAKNRGIRAASGDVVVFTDDDCEWADDYLVALLRYFASGSDPVVRGGRVALGDSDDMPFTIKELDHMEVYDGTRHPGGFIHGCNLAVSRSVFEIVGLFDERFGPGAEFRAAEDTDFVYRAYKKNLPVIYAPDMVVYHFHGRKSRNDVFRLNKSYQFGNGALHLKHGLADRLLARNLYWNMRGYAKEFMGGGKFDEVLGLSHREIVIPQLAGMWSYALSSITGQRA